MKRLFEKVLVCPPSENYPNCLSTHPDKSSINLDLARRQHDGYVAALREHAIAVDTLASSYALPDSVFVQDPALIGKNTVLIGRSREPSRLPEGEIIARFFKDRGKTIERMNAEATLEGGDILVTEDALFVGVTGRSNPEAVKELDRAFPGIDVIGVKFARGFFHLLSVCSYLADDQILVCDRFVDPSVFRGYECLRVDAKDVVAANVLHLGDGKILMPTGYERVRKLIQDSGYDPVEIDNSEFVKGDGRITCLSSPFYANLD